jgi:serine/threonine-protein kinase
VPDPTTTLPAFDPASLVGTTLDGRYLIEEHLATGGMGAVFRGRHVYMRKDVALKVLRPDLSASSELVERFRRESEIAASLEHDNIVKVTDFGRTPEGWLFLAMELLFGESLFDRLRREGFLPPEEAVPVLWQVCAGLEAAHARGVVHRDLKPENVFLARSAGGREVVKILDFGIAKIADPHSDSATQAGMVVGTPEYLSPEQATGSAVDGRADLYTVGLIAFRMLTGRHPFKADEPRALLMMQATRPVPPITEPRPDLAAWPALVTVVERACQKDPAARYQTAGDMRADLGAVLGPHYQPPLATPAALSGAGPLASLRPTTSGTMRLGAPVTSPGGAPALTPALPRTSPGPAPVLPELAPPAPVATRWIMRRRGRLAVLAGALALLVVLAGLWVAGSLRPGPAPVASPAATAGTTFEAELAAARAALTDGRARDARAILERLARDRPAEPELDRLLGHAWLDEGDAPSAIEAWTRAQAAGQPLDAASLEHLAGLLTRDKALADRAARLLVRGGREAGPALNGAIAHGGTVVKLRALAVAREIGPSVDVDVLGGYQALLGDPDCDVRRAAARGLGDLGDRRALPRLRERAADRNERRGLFGVLIESKPVCGAAEAGEAVKKLEGK